MKINNLLYCSPTRTRTEVLSYFRTFESTKVLSKVLRKCVRTSVQYDTTRAQYNNNNTTTSTLYSTKVRRYFRTFVLPEILSYFRMTEQAKLRVVIYINSSVLTRLVRVKVTRGVSGMIGD